MAQGTSIGSLFFSTGIDFSGFKRDAKQGQSAMSGLFNPAIIGTAALGAAMIKLGSDALKFSKEFETAFSEVQTISQSARENADEMSAAILKMTTEIPVGAVDSTKALYQIVSAGFDGAEAMSVLEISAKAAVAGVTTTATAADTLTTIINAYGLDAQEATNISDALFKTVELGKTTLAEIGSSFSQVASIAAAYGVDVNEALAATAAMTKQGAPTAQAMTAIKAAIVSVTEKMGENVFRTNSFGDALQMARTAADKSGQGLQSYFGRLEAVNGVLMLTNQNADVYSDSLDQINTSAGSADKALAIMNDTLESQETLLANNFTLLKKQFGDVLSDLEKNILPGLNRELKILGDDTIPGYAKALSVVANIASLGFGNFTAEGFSPEIVKSILRAERAVEDFTQKTKSLSNEVFANEVDNIKEQRDANLKSFEDLEDRKKKGFKFDADALEEAKDRNLIFYQILEKAEERLAQIKEKSGTDPKTPKGGVVPVKITLGSLKKELKDLNDSIATASKTQAVEIEVKIRAKEDELKDFVTDINDRVRSIQAKADGLTGITLKPITKGVELSKQQTKELKKQGKQLKTNNGIWVKTQTEINEAAINTGLMTDQLFQVSDITGELAGLASNFDDELAESLTTVSALAEGVSNIVEGYASGNYAQAIAGGAQVVGQFFSKDQEITASESIDNFISALNSAQDALDKLNGRNFDKEIVAIEATFEKVVDMVSDFQKLTSAYAGYDFFGGAIEGEVTIANLDTAITSLAETIASGVLSGKLLRDSQEILDKYIALKDELNAITQEITGTNSDELADSLSLIFQNGEDAAIKWGETVEEVIRNVIVNQLKSQLLVQPIQEALNQLTLGAAEDGLSVEEANQFKETVNALQGDYADAFALLNDTFKEAGIDLSGATDAAESGLAGAIGRQITEDTATELQGIWNRSLFETISHTQILNDSNGYLSAIADNTLRTADTLDDLNSKISVDSSERDTGNVL